MVIRLLLMIILNFFIINQINKFFLICFFRIIFLLKILEIIAFKKNSVSKSPMKTSIENLNGFSENKENNSYVTVIDEGMKFSYFILINQI